MRPSAATPGRPARGTPAATSRSRSISGRMTSSRARSAARMPAPRTSPGPPSHRDAGRRGPAGIVVCCDAVDGSSNLDVGGAWAPSSRCAPLGAARPRARPRWGRWTIKSARASALGPATVLVYSIGAGTRGFTLDRERGEFSSRIPTSTCRRRARPTASTRGNSPPGIRGSAPRRASPPSDRALGGPTRSALGGHRRRHAPHAPRRRISCTPRTCPIPTSQPKLRLLYKVAPMAFLAEQAGGRRARARSGAEDPPKDVVSARPSSSGAPRIARSPNLLSQVSDPPD